MTDTKTKILDLAECLTQTNGFNGFSYLDIAEEIGIKGASVHYHFKSKDDLAVALVERLRELHMTIFRQMETSIADPSKRIEAVIMHFQQYAEEDKFCLCGMMAAELYSLSERVSNSLNKYFNDYQNWLTRQFEALGHENATLQAIQFLSALEGSLLLARLRKSPKVVSETMVGFL